MRFGPPPALKPSASSSAGNARHRRSPSTTTINGSTTANDTAQLRTTSSSSGKRIVYVKHVAAKVPSHIVPKASSTRTSSLRKPPALPTTTATSTTTTNTTGLISKVLNKNAATTTSRRIAMQPSQIKNTSDSGTSTTALKSRALRDRCISNQRMSTDTDREIDELVRRTQQSISLHGKESNMPRVPSTPPQPLLKSRPAAQSANSDLDKENLLIFDGEVFSTPDTTPLRTTTTEMHKDDGADECSPVHAMVETPLQLSTNQPTTKNAKDTPSRRLFAVKDVDGAFAIAYTTVRVAPKDRETFGVDRVITPVKKSLRVMNSLSYEEMQAKGMEQVPGLDEMFETTGYAYTPNKALK